MIKISVGSISNAISRIFKKINSPYRITITNETSMEEAMVIHLTKKSVYIFLSSIFVILFFLFSIIILFTPLKYYVPGNSSTISRQKLIKIQKLADSLVKLNNSREKYIFNLVSVANGHIDATKDTTTLTASQIQEALQNNTSKIDHASKYNYLKVKKKDTTSVESVEKKDSL